MRQERPLHEALRGRARDFRPANRRHGKRGRIDIWLASIEAACHAPVLRHCREILTPQEVESCSVFQREADRRRAIVSRALLRETLSRYAPVRPEAWEFVPGTHGKPAIAAPAGLRLRFNLSHTGRLVACAVTLDDEIGVDLEDMARELDPLELAESVFSLEEIAALRALVPESQRRRFFETWTLKEAYLKARGLGFALDPRSAGFDLGKRGRVCAHFAPGAEDHPAGWWFALLGTHSGHVLALAARNGGLPACVRTFLATPGDKQAEWIESRLYAECRRLDSPR